MKLFAPILAATMMQDTEAACADDGGAVFSVTCHEDLMIELEVSEDCLNDNFPDLKLTDLEIQPTGADGTVPSGQCLPCTKANAQTSDDGTAATYCDPTASFFAFDYSETSPVAAPVTDDASATTKLWFKAGNCGTSPMTFSDDGTKAIFATTIGKPAVIDSTTGIVTQPTLIATDITCSYPSTISGLPMDPGMSVVADASADTDKIKQDDAPNEVSDDLFEMKAQEGNSSGPEITSTSSITLGETVWIGVKSTDSALGTNFYLSDCTATNGEDKQVETSPGSGTYEGNDDYKELELVKGGCIATGDLAGSLSTDISAATGEEGVYQYLEFNQFAFADSSQSALSLGFTVTCDIVLGTAPTDAVCETRRDGRAEVPASGETPAVPAITADASLTGTAGRRRRSVIRRAASSEYQESTEYTVTAGNRISDAHGDIVVAHSGESKADMNSGAAVTSAAAFMAGTAIMLL